MRYKIRIGSLLLMLTLLLGIMFIPFSQGETYQAAATSYTNAKAFYESTGLDGLSYHADAANGSFYIATCSKLASTSYGLSSRTSGHLMYRSLGYDITLFTDDGYEVSFSVKRDGSIEFMEEAQVNYGGYQYDLWCISTKTLYDLAIATNVTVAEKVLSAPIIHIKADAIMATVLNGEASGYIEEIEKGDISIVGTVYRLKDKSKLYDMRDMFSGHDFDSYYDIVEQLENYELQIRYSLQGTDAANLGCTSVVEVSNTDFRLVNYKENGVTTPYVLYNKAQGKIYTTARTVLNRFSLLNPETIGLSKKGYHLIKGKEWIFDNVSFSANSIYEPKDVCADAGFRNRKIYMYANWQRNEYTIEYNANGGRGTIPSQKMYYDKMGYLL